MNLRAVASLPRQARGGHWFRAVKPKYVGNPLALGYTADRVSRYSPGVDARITPFQALYLAADPIVALREVEAIYGSVAILPNPIDAWCVVPYECALTAVIDLNDPAGHALLGTSLQELTGPWRSAYYPGHDAPTHLLGEECFRQPDVEGILFPSAKGGGTNLLIFPEKVAGTSWVSCKDATGVERRL